VADALRPATTELLLVSNTPSAGKWLPDVTTFADVRVERSSLTGIHTALVHADGPVLVVAWDMPFLTTELLTVIAETGSAVRFAAIPVGPAGDEPMCGVYHPAVLPIIESALNAGDFKLSNLIARLPVVDRIPADRIARIGNPQRFFFNVNDVQNLETARQMAADG
jgi:molybdopterin-guanine dinucleotide biosynthesis protein A